MKIFNTSFYAALIMASCLTPAAAAGGNFYAFGDSLVDNGNIPKLIGQNYPPPPYYENHFSNGKVWAEYLPGLTGLGFKPSNDYGVGGAFSGPLNVLGFTVNDLENLPMPVGEGFNLPLPSFLQQVQAFQATGTHFGNGDVVGVWVGANDYFTTLALVEFHLANPATAIPATVQTVATQTAQGVDELAALGARRFIVFTLPDLGLTPEFNTSAAATIAQANAISQAHGQALAVALAGVHAGTGANVIVINAQQLFNELLVDPAAYGKTNVTDACIATPACVNAPTAVQNEYLFWDAVHPTTGTHLTIAEYAAQALNGVAGLTVPAQITAFGASAFAGQLDARAADLAAGATGFAFNLPQQGMVAQLGADDANAVAAAGKLSGFIASDYSFGNRKAASNDAGYNYDIGNFTVGLDDRLAPGVALGAAFGYGTDHGTSDGGGKISADAYQFGAYASLYRPAYYINLHAAYGFDDYDNSRPAVLAGGIKAKPSGDTYDIGAATGLLLNDQNITYGPIAGIEAAQAHIGGYTETGDAALTQSVEAQNFSRVVADFGAAVASSVAVGPAVLRPRLSVTADDLLSGNGGSFDSVFTDEPLVPITSVYPKSTHVWAVISGSVAAALTPQLELTADFASTFAKSDGENHEVSGNLKYRF